MRLLILGAGYGGLAVATQLRPTSGLDVTLIEKNPYHTFETRLHEAAAHNTRVTLPLRPLLRGTGVRFEQQQVRAVDLDTRTVQLQDGTARSYEVLVAALGSVTNFYRIPGLSEHATELKDLADADEIFHFLNQLYTAEHQGPRDIVVGGAGLTGVELVTELAQRARILSEQRGQPPFQLHLVEAGPHILPALEPNLRAKAAQTLADYGIQVYTSHRLIRAMAAQVALQTPEGQEKLLPAGKIIWTGGIQARDILSGQRLEQGPGQRILVDEFLRAKQYSEVFVVGDMALALNREGQAVPTTAQHAGQQGRLTGQNLRRLVQGRPLLPYEPSTLGEFVSLGGLMAVGWMKLPWNQKLALSGGLAHLIKRASEWKWQRELTTESG